MKILECPECGAGEVTASPVAGRVACVACSTERPLEAFHNEDVLRPIAESPEARATIVIADAQAMRMGNRMVIVFVNRDGELRTLPGGIFNDEWYYQQGCAIIHKTEGDR